jgi:hypothetical protein
MPQPEHEPDPNMLAFFGVIAAAVLLVSLVLITFGLIWSWKRYNKRLRSRSKPRNEQTTSLEDPWQVAGQRYQVPHEQVEDDEDEGQEPEQDGSGRR